MFLNSLRISTPTLRCARPAVQLRALSLSAARFNAVAEPTSALAQAADLSAVKPTTPASDEPLPYFVHRTATNHLPVYHDRKRGGNLRLTVIRKLEGNLQVLREQLINELKLDPSKVYINNLTKQIIIKGEIQSKVMRFLEQKKF